MKLFMRFFDRIIQRYLPDAFLFAVLLTFVVYVLGVVMTPSNPWQMVSYWGNGFWALLTFAMQMCLIVVTGHVLANTPFIKWMLKRISGLAKTPGQAVILVTFVAMSASLVNYGFGLVVGALIAIEVMRQVPSADYRVLVASGYTGYLLWHGGLSGSIPLLIATPGHFLENQMGLIPVTQTIFSNFNLFIIIVLFCTVPFVNHYCAKHSPPFQVANLAHLIDETDDVAVAPVSNSEPLTPAEKIENSATVTLLIGALGLAFIAYHFMNRGFDLNLNIVNFTMLFLGILLHRTPKRFLDSLNHAVKNVGGIILQFPFYAGIMGMMINSGLSAKIAMFFVDISTEFSYPFFTFLSAGLINFFVPSGGGQWAVQGPIMVTAGMEIGIDNAKTAMAVAWGDAWTNMIQPFWTLPLLAIAGLKARDIMGFCFMVLAYSAIPISIGLLFID